MEVRSARRVMNCVGSSCKGSSNQLQMSFHTEKLNCINNEAEFKGIN